MGPRGFRVSLAQNCCQGRLHQGRFNNHIVLSSMNIVLKAKHGTLPPPPRKGGLLPNVVYTGVCRWTGYGFGLCPDTW